MKTYTFENPDDYSSFSRVLASRYDGPTLRLYASHSEPKRANRSQNRKGRWFSTVGSVCRIFAPDFAIERFRI